MISTFNYQLVLYDCYVIFMKKYGVKISMELYHIVISVLSQSRKGVVFSFNNLGMKCLAVLALALFVSTTKVYSTQATLIWNQNLEDDLAGYKLYYGTSSSNYNKSDDVGNVTIHTLLNLVKGATYFIAVTAYDLSGNESDFSNEVVYFVAANETNENDVDSTNVPLNIVLSKNSAGKSVLPDVVDVRVKDHDGKPMSNILVKAYTNGTGVIVYPNSKRTSAEGKAQFDFRFKLFADEGQIIFSAGSSIAILIQAPR